MDDVRRVQREIARAKPTMGGQRRYHEPRQRNQRNTPGCQNAHRRHRTPRPNRIQTGERPPLRTPERHQHKRREREPATARQVSVDRRQPQGHDHRVRVGDQNLLRIAVDPQYRDRAKHRSDQRRPRTPRGRARQPVGNPCRKHRSCKRRGSGGDHPQPHLRVRASQRVRQREQEGQRLPRRRTVGVQIPMKRLPTPRQPTESVIGRTHPRQHDPRDRDYQHATRNRDPHRPRTRRTNTGLRSVATTVDRPTDRGCCDDRGHRADEAIRRRVRSR